MSLPPYLVLQKAVGETPLSCVDAYRATHPELSDVALAYAGRLDPMASGTLLILVGDTCKVQEQYHGLDKAYEFSILFGISSDTHDVLGRLKTDTTVPTISPTDIAAILPQFHGLITLPYPHFSSKTVGGKPLHTWTLEGRLHEITIPKKTSEIYTLTHTGTRTLERASVCVEALQKIATIPPVTDPRKALGSDFRRVDVRNDWERVASAADLPATYQIASFTCIASSGTYMRTLAQVISEQLGTHGLAWRIHRTQIGRYQNGTWVQVFT